MSSKTIELTEPIEANGERIETLVLRAPTLADWLDLGAPTTWVSLAAGGGFVQENSAVLGQWISRLAGVEQDCLRPMCLRDTLAVRDAVFGFFAEAGAPPGEDQKTARLNAPTGEASKWH